ncbi:VWA domain-containing protein [Streptomyces pseudoechinosporeus]
MSSPTRPPQLDIRLSVDHERDLRPHRSAKIEAHLRVEIADTGVPAELPAVELAVIIALDLAEPHRHTVRHALRAALLALPDGISFAVLGSGPEPSLCYPVGGEEWAVAGARDKGRAAFAAEAVTLHRDGPRPAGYAAWAARARALLAARPLSVRHLVLITDGSSGPGETHLEEELDACAGQFTCDVLAIGTDWAPDPLLTIAERLHGTAEFVEDQLGNAITGAIRRLRRVHSPELPIEVTARPTVRQVGLGEKAPRPHRLGGLLEPGRPHRWRFPTYQWESGVRDYLLTLAVDAETDPLETDLQFAMVSIGDQSVPVVARWHRADERKPCVVDPEGGASVRSMKEATAMHLALRTGLRALEPLQREVAERHLGEAARLATRLGAEHVLENIRVFADIIDTEAGRVRLHATVNTDTLGQRILWAGSRPGGPLTEAPTRTGSGPRCAGCGHRAGREARYCIKCGGQLL